MFIYRLSSEGFKSIISNKKKKDTRNPSQVSIANYIESVSDTIEAHRSIRLWFDEFVQVRGGDL